MPPLARWIAVAAVLVFLAQASLSWSWVIDDAGISLAYSRTLAAGEGLRAQPGAPPVEGFSNPLWMLAFALLYGLGLVRLPLTVKLVSLALVALAGWISWWACQRLGGEDGESLWAGTWLLTAMNVAVPHWALSGLENPLTLLLAWGSLAALLATLNHPGSRRRALALGAVSGLLVWNRPDGLALALAPMVVALILGVWERRAPAWLGRYLGVLAAMTAALFLARYALFGAVLPNTALVKGGPEWDFLLRWWGGDPGASDKLLALVIRLVGSAASPAVLAAGLLGAAGLGAAGRLDRRHLAVTCYAGVAAATYLLLPADWMDETRFATAFYPLAYATGLALLARALAAVEAVRRARLLALVVITLAALYLPEAYFRVLRAEGRANVGLELVARAHGERFHRLADLVGLGRGVLAVQDLGGTLLTSRHRVVDLAGLCDRRVAETLGKDRGALRDYLFEEVRPDFMVLHGAWASEIRAEEDPRFARDYEWVFRASPEADPPAKGHASGVFVRREHVDGRPEVLEALRAEEHRLESFDREPNRGPVWDLLLQVPLLPRPLQETLTHPTLAEG